MGGVTNATNSQIAQNTKLDQASTTSSEPEAPQSSAESPKTQEDPVAAARRQQGLIQNAAEYKNQSNFHGQYMREELSKHMQEGPGKPVLFGDNATAHAAPAATQLGNEVSDPSFRNLGKQLAEAGKVDPGKAASIVQNTWNSQPISNHAPIAYETAKNLSDQDLEKLTRTAEGRQFLHQVENGMQDGNVEPAHQAQIDRIRQAVLRRATPSKELSTSLLNQATGSGPVKAQWIANELNKEIKKDMTNGARTANKVLDKALPADRARIATELTRSLTPDQLKELLQTPDGRKLIDQMSAANIPYREVKKLAAVPDGEKDPTKRSMRAMAMAERMVLAAGPNDKDDAIAMLARTKKQLVADGHGPMFEHHLNDMPFQVLLGPFGLRHLEGPGDKLWKAHLDNFDDAVRNWEKMKPAEREMARNPHLHGGQRPPLGKDSHDYHEIQKEAKENDTNQTMKTLEDGSIYNGPVNKLKEAEIAAHNRVMMAKINGIKTAGPLSLAGRVIGSIADGIAGTNVWAERLAAAGQIGDFASPRAAAKAAKVRQPNQPETPTPRPPANVRNATPEPPMPKPDVTNPRAEVAAEPKRSSVNSNARQSGTAPTQPAQQKGQQPNVGTAPNRNSNKKDLAEPAKGSEIKRAKTPDVNRMSTSDKGKLTVAERSKIQQEISERSTIRKDLVRQGAKVLETEGIDHVASNHKSVVAGLKRVADDPWSHGQAEAKRLLNQINEQTEVINHLSGVMANPPRSTLK